MSTNIDIGVLFKKAGSFLRQDPGYVLINVPYVIAMIVFMISYWFIIGADFFFLTSSSPITTDTSQSFFTLLQEKLLLLIALFGIFILLMDIMSVLISIAVIKKAEMHVLGKKLGLSDAFSQGLSLFPRVFITLLVSMILIAGPIFGLYLLLMIGFVTNLMTVACISTALLGIIIIPWMFISIRVSLFLQACVLEQLGPLDSLKRSWMVTKGKVILIFVIGLILGIIGMVVYMPFIIINMLVPSLFWISWIGMSLLILIIQPYFQVLLTLLYLEFVKPNTPQPVTQGSPLPMTPQNPSG